MRVTRRAAVAIWREDGVVIFGPVEDRGRALDQILVTAAEEAAGEKGGGDYLAWRHSLPDVLLCEQAGRSLALRDV